MTETQMIEVANAGFETNKGFSKLKINDLGFMHKSGIYRLYDKTKGFDGNFPKESILTIHLESGFAQLSAGHRRFDHFAAIKCLESLLLVIINDCEHPENMVISLANGYASYCKKCDMFV